MFLFNCQLIIGDFIPYFLSRLVVQGSSGTNVLRCFTWNSTIGPMLICSVWNGPIDITQLFVLQNLDYSSY